VALRYLPAAARVALPWKNGGGVTREITAWPPGAGMDDFDWRISMANVDVAGPFSRFEGVDRVLAILSGVLALRFEDGAPTRLDEKSGPLAFAGEAACLGTPRDGGVVDLNVMIRRGWGRAKVRRQRQAEPIACTGDALFLLALDAAILGGAPCGPWDAVLAERGDVVVITGPAPRLIVVEIDALG
jgi:environmental stress-induced protein Ves